MSGVTALSIGQLVGGDYRVMRPLAEGGMGAVYVVEQLSTGKRRALKVMHAAIVSDGPSRERFLREAQVGAQIESEHIVEVIAAGVDATTGLPWLAMELLEGGSLETLVAQRGAVPLRDLLRLYEQIGHALSAAHAAGIVHRDLKPENVFVAVARRTDSPFVVKILDFGIAKLVQSASAAHNSQLIGTPLWMAPEQLSPSSPIGPATDVWPLGLIAFYMLTGKIYWRSAHALDASMQAVLAEQLVAPIDAASVRAAAYGLADRLPAGFDGWFAKCVARDANARFRSVGALIVELTRLASPPAAVEVSRSRGASAVLEAGARLAAVEQPTTASPLPSTVVGGPPATARRAPPASLAATMIASADSLPAVARTVVATPTSRRTSRLPAIIGGAVLAIAAAVAITLALQDGSDADATSFAPPPRASRPADRTQRPSAPAPSSTPTVHASPPPAAAPLSTCAGRWTGPMRDAYRGRGTATLTMDSRNDGACGRLVERWGSRTCELRLTGCAGEAFAGRATATTTSRGCSNAGLTIECTGTATDATLRLREVPPESPNDWAEGTLRRSD